MKKISFLLILCFFFQSFFAYAFDNSLESAPVEEDPAHRELRVPDRAFEAGLNADFSFANNALPISKILQETLVVDLDKLADGLKINLGIGALLYFKYDIKREWGIIGLSSIGLSTGVDSVGDLDLSGDMLSFKMTEYSKSNLSRAVFGSVGIDTFFQIQEFKVKFRPAMYYTFVYVKPDISYAYNNTDQETQFFIDLDLRIFTAYSSVNSMPTAAPGIDFSAGVEYPLSKETGISEKYPILDFDVGIDFVNVPVVFSTMSSYRRMSTVLGSKEPVNIEDLMSSFGIGDSSPVYGEGEEKVYRPFKTLVWADWRLFLGNLPLSVIPTVGFSVSNLYLKPAAVEAGLKARLNFADRYFLTGEIGYYDHLWRNSLDFALTFKAFDFNIGADLRSSDFIKSWTGHGSGVRAGFKFRL